MEKNMTEMIDIYDADFNLIGKEERNEAHRKGLWHQAFLCWIVKSNGKLILQLRSKDKSTNPNLLDVSCGGHIVSGETVEEGIRELKEELGIDIEFKDLSYFGYFKWATDKPNKTIIPYHNREFCHTFFYKCDKPLNEYVLQAEELDGIFELDLNNGRKLFSKEVDGIKINGYLRTDDNTLKKVEKTVTLKDFTKYRNFWLRTFNLAEDFLNGRKYLAI